jgi:hypothetical protein
VLATPSPQPVAKSRGTRNVLIGIVVIVVVAIIAIASLGLISNPLSSGSNTTQSTQPPATVTLTAANMQVVYPNAATSGYLGPSSQSLNVNGLPQTFAGGQEFSLTISLNNQASIITSHTISLISTNTQGFTVNSVSPTLPYTLGPGASVTFTITLTTPNTNYDGPYTIVVTTS